MPKIAIMGHGVVGSGTAEVFFKNKPGIEKRAGKSLDIKYILDVRDPSEFAGLPYGDRFVNDFDIILNDPEIAVAAELIGGIEPAFTFAEKLLTAGKSVVTSNKELVAKKGAYLLKLARDNNVNFFFEASVGGGIPIIRPLSLCFSAGRINEVAGILNGTTNFILTKMFRDGMEFADALKLAQDNGYAERDPSDDVGGADACRKICILASMAFGKQVDPDRVPFEGITGVTKADIDFCTARGGAVKLIGIARRNQSGGVDAEVCPAFVGGGSQLAGVDDVFNAILVRGEETGDVVFYGKGAGKYPTASAVISDILNALKTPDNPHALCWEESEGSDYGGLVSGFYARTANGAFITGEMTRAEFNAKYGGDGVITAMRVFDNL